MVAKELATVLYGGVSESQAPALVVGSSVGAGEGAHDRTVLEIAQGVIHETSEHFYFGVVVALSAKTH